MADRKYILYKHTAPSGKVYIGITCQSATRRWKNGFGYKSHSHFWNAIQKYGWDNIKHEVLLNGLSRREAGEKEREYILKYRSNNPAFGYNLTTGGESGYEFPPEVLAKQSDGLKRKWRELEYLKKMKRVSDAKVGLRWNHSEQTKAKMRKPKSEETKIKMRKPKSEETRRKMSEAKKKYFAGMTPEQKEQFSKRVSEAMKKAKQDNI